MPLSLDMKGLTRQLLWTLRGTGEFIYLLLPHFRSQDNQNYLDWLYFPNIKSGFQLLLETPPRTESLTRGILYFTSLNNCPHFLLVNYSRIKRLVNRDENKHIFQCSRKDKCYNYKENVLCSRLLVSLYVLLRGLNELEKGHLERQFAPRVGSS